MIAYVFQADLWCEDCTDRVKASIDLPAGADLADESTWDSDMYPKGPYEDGGGEADSPQHCAGCRIFLRNPLTEDGFEYVRERLKEPGGNAAVLVQWATFYCVRPSLAVVAGMSLEQAEQVYYDHLDVCNPCNYGEDCPCEWAPEEVDHACNCHKGGGWGAEVYKLLKGKRSEASAEPSA